MAGKERKRRNGLPGPADEHDRKLLAGVEQHGWHVIGVEDDGEGPGFAYSIGLHHTPGHPEVILFGLPVRVMHPIINGTGEQVKGLLTDPNLVGVPDDPELVSTFLDVLTASAIAEGSGTFRRGRL